MGISCLLVAIYGLIGQRDIEVYSVMVKKTNERVMNLDFMETSIVFM